MKKITKNLQLSRQKTVKILRFFDEKAKNNSKKDVSFFADIGKVDVVINCKRLATLCDNHTKKLLKETSKSLQSKNEVTSLQETETEVRSKKKDKQSERAPSRFQFKVCEYLDNILETCEIIKTLKQKGKIFNPYMWVQFHTNKSGHPQAILESLEGLVAYWSTAENPWGYADKILKTKSQNYNEADFVKQQEEFKKKFSIDPRIKKLLGDIGNE